MGGMCLGSIALPRMISARRHPLRVYAFLELGTGAFGFAVLFGLPLVQHLYTASIGHGLPGILLRSVASAICLLPPTLMMGATLPAISRWIETTPEAASRWGFFYGGNIAGGVFGCLLAGFYLLRIHNMATASYVAAFINVTVALASLALARSGISTKRPPPVRKRPRGARTRGRYISPSHSPAFAHWAPKSSGRAHSRLCWARPFIRSRSFWACSLRGSGWEAAADRCFPEATRSPA